MASFIDTAVPEGARPAVRLLLKHHFWILSVLVPLVLLPLLFAGSGAIGTQIESRRQEIDGKLSQVKQVAQVNPHPNEEWSKAIDSQADTVRQEIEGEWKRLWESQTALRVWPEELGNDFLRGIGRLRTNDQLPRALLQRYQTTVQRLVRKLPERMGVPAAAVDMVADGAMPGGGMMPGRGGMAPGMMTPGGVGPGMAGPGGPGEGPGGTPFQPAKMIWNPGDQARIFQSFVWTTVPTTRQVLMAQEQLWVYGLFCDLMREFTKSATGPHDSPVAVVEEIAISHDAAEPGPGGMGESRVFLPPQPRGADSGMGMGAGMSAGMGSGMGSGMDMGSGGMGRMAGRGMRLRPGSGSGDMSGGMGSGAMPGMMDSSTGPAATSGPPGDAELLSYAYVDFGGRALTAEELMTEPGAEMTHLMPFVLRVVIDQRQIDALLVALAASEIPIDVRQIRINPGAAGQLSADGGMGGMSGMGGMGGMSGMSGMGAMPGMMSGGFGDTGGFGGSGMGTAGLRRHDVRLELRGTVALATKPGDPVTIAPAAGTDTRRFGDRIRQTAWHERRGRSYRSFPSWARRFQEARS